MRAVTVDPAMLIYLDGVANAKGNVNENYGREVLELFSLGIGHYTEDDVRAGADRPVRMDPRPRLQVGQRGRPQARRHAADLSGSHGCA